MEHRRWCNAPIITSCLLQSDTDLDQKETYWYDHFYLKTRFYHQAIKPVKKFLFSLLSSGLAHR